MIEKISETENIIKYILSQMSDIEFHDNEQTNDTVNEKITELVSFVSEYE